MLFNAIPAARYAFPITPGDTAGDKFPTNAKGIWVGGAGTLTAIMTDGSTVLFSGIPAGTLLPIEASQVKSSGTTATLLVGLVP